MVCAYEELIDFITGDTTSGEIIVLHPSDESKSRIWDLIQRKRQQSLTADETSELEHYLQLEHLMRLAKVREQQFIVSTNI